MSAHTSHMPGPEKYSVTYLDPVTARWWTRVFVGLKRTIAFVVAMRGRGYEAYWGRCSWPPCEQSTDVSGPYLCETHKENITCSGT